MIFNERRGGVVGDPRRLLTWEVVPRAPGTRSERTRRTLGNGKWEMGNGKQYQVGINSIAIQGEMMWHCGTGVLGCIGDLESVY